MNTNLAFDFSVDKEKNTITVKREFDAELLLVWDAYTKPEILDQWWAPKPWKTKTKSMDFRVGGKWLYAMIGPNPGEEHGCFCNYTEIAPQKKYAGTDGFLDANGNVIQGMPQAKWDVSFTAKAGITLVEIKISYADLSQLEATIKMGFKEGLSMAMENLDALLPELKRK